MLYLLRLVDVENQTDRNQTKGLYITRKVSTGSLPRTHPETNIREVRTPSRTVFTQE